MFKNQFLNSGNLKKYFWWKQKKKMCTITQLPSADGELREEEDKWQETNKIIIFVSYFSFCSKAEER